MMLQLARSPEESLRTGYPSGELRYEVLLAAEIESDLVSTPVAALIKNISCGGAKARVCADLDIDGEIAVAIRGSSRRMGRVVWKNGNEIGINFHQRIDPLAILDERRVEMTRLGNNVLQFVMKAKQRLGLGDEFPLRMCLAASSPASPATALLD